MFSVCCFKRSSFESPHAERDYSHLFDPVVTGGSDVDLDNIRFRITQQIKGEDEGKIACENYIGFGLNLS